MDYWRQNPPGQPGDPTQADALAMIEAMKSLDSGEPFDSHRAHRAFMLHGYPELRPDAVSRWVAERWMRPRPAAQKPCSQAGQAVLGINPPDAQKPSPNHAPYHGSRVGERPWRVPPYDPNNDKPTQQKD